MIQLHQKCYIYLYYAVRVLIRDVRIATCTSGEPVSPSLIAYSLIKRAFSSAVIDIGVSLVKVDGTCRDIVQQGPWSICFADNQLYKVDSNKNKVKNYFDF